MQILEDEAIILYMIDSSFCEQQIGVPSSFVFKGNVSSVNSFSCKKYKMYVGTTDLATII
jgi:hypothetical protein